MWTPEKIHAIARSWNFFDVTQKHTLIHAVYCLCLFNWKSAVWAKQDCLVLIIRAAVYYTARLSFFSGLWNFSLRYLILSFIQVANSYVRRIPKLSWRLLEAFTYQFSKCNFFITNVRSIVNVTINFGWKAKNGPIVLYKAWESLRWAPTVVIVSDVTSW